MHLQGNTLFNYVASYSLYVTSLLRPSCHLNKTLLSKLCSYIDPFHVIRGIITISYVGHPYNICMQLKYS